MPLDPIFVSAKEAAAFLSVGEWQVYRLLDEKAIEERRLGRRRLIVVQSLREYAEALPSTGPESAA